ncbi:MAG TPA: hypothetical protein PKA82_17160 [Pyrinomonadaceae bacterium]|nr:hypothetical protein [Pyrinomonadaceae bacterium]
MKKTTLLLGIAILMFASMGFECSVTTANLGDVKFAKDKEGKTPGTSFDAGTNFFALVDATGIPSGKHKLTWKPTYENVTGKTKGEPVGAPGSLDVTGSGTAFAPMSFPLPGDYKIEATLADESGKTIATKSATVKITGSAPAAAPPAGDDKKSDDKDDEDK